MQFTLVSLGSLKVYVQWCGYEIWSVERAAVAGAGVLGRGLGSGRLLQYLLLEQNRLEKAVTSSKPSTELIIAEIISIVKVLSILHLCL